MCIIILMSIMEVSIGIKNTLKTFYEFQSYTKLELNGYGLKTFLGQ